MAEEQHSGSDDKARVVAAWAGVTMTLVAIVGILILPSARILWITLLVFGVATVPQVLVWRRPASERQRAPRRRTPR